MNYDQAIKLNPKNADYYYKKGMLMSKYKAGVLKTIFKYE